MLFLLQEDLTSIVADSHGFKHRAERPNATGHARQKWGWSAFKPGADQLTACLLECDLHVALLRHCQP